MLGFDALGRLALGQAPASGTTYMQAVTVACAGAVTVALSYTWAKAVTVACSSVVSILRGGWVTRTKQNETWTER